MIYLREIFDDWLTRAAGVILALTVVLVVFTTATDLLQLYPLAGVFTFSLVRLLFVLGGGVFVGAIVGI